MVYMLFDKVNTNFLLSMFHPRSENSFYLNLWLGYPQYRFGFLRQLATYILGRMNDFYCFIVILIMICRHFSNYIARRIISNY